LGWRAYCIMAIQTGTDTVYHTPHEVLQSALADSVLFLEKATVGRAQMSDISDALSEYKRLFSVKLASPAEILTLSRAYPDNQKYAKAAEGIEDDSMPVVVGGPASVEMVDREGHLITTNALTKAFKKYMANFRTRNTMVMHSDVQVGWALPAYITKGGSVFRSGVDPKGLFFITELRNDTRIAAKVKEQIESGKMRSYSIAGNATESKDIHREDGTKIMQVDNLELAEVTICEKGVNQGAHFDLMKGMILDKEQSTSTTVSSNDLLLEETLSKGIFSRKKDIDLDDPKLPARLDEESRQAQEMQAKTDAKLQNFRAQSDKLDAATRNHENTPAPKMSQGTSDALAEINALSASKKAKTPKIEESLNKGITDTLGISQRARDTKAAKNFRSRYQEGGEAHEGVSSLNEMLTNRGAKPVASPSTVRRAATETYNRERSEGSSPKEAAKHTDNVTSRAVSRTARRNIQPHLEAKYLNKSTPMLGMFQEFMEKAKGSTDTPLGLQANHPDQQGEDDRRAQLKRVQEEFGLPEETHSAEYNRRAPVDYKMPHSFSSSRVVNQSGQDSAVAHPDIHSTTEKIKLLQKAGPIDRLTGGRVKFETNPDKQSNPSAAKGGFEVQVQTTPGSIPDKLARTGAKSAPTPPHYQLNPETGSTAREGAKSATESAGLEYASKMQKIDKVLSKLFQKAGKDKEDRSPGNSAKPNEFPADTSTSPYQSKGVFEKAGDDLRQDGITNHPPRRSPLTKPEDDRTSKLNLSKAGLYENIHAKRKSGKRMRSEGDSKAPTDADFKDAAKSLTKDATGTTNRGFRQEGGAGRKASFQGIKGSKPQRPNKYKDIDRTTPRKPVEKAAQTPGMGQQKTPQGPTSNWGDPTRAAQPTMRQRQPWDEKSMEKNEDEGKTLPSKPSLNTAQAPKHDVSGAAANRARVEAAKGKDAATQYKAPRDPANKIIDSEAKKKKSGWAGFPSSRSSGDFDEKSLSKTNPDPVEEGKAILAMPFNLATQMIMGKKAPSAVSADDRLRESVLVLLKQSDQRFGNV
jgi:HK97 family phage prohead protease